MSNQAQPNLTATDDGGHQRTELARRHAHQRAAFRIHAIVFAGSMIVIAFVNAALNAAAGILDEWWAWWSVPALFGWGIGVSIHGLVVRLARPQRLDASDRAPAPA